MKTKENRPREKNRRRGLTLFAVLVCLAVASVIMIGSVGFSIRHRMQLRNEIQLEQTYWLLDAGIGAALDKVRQDPEFKQLDLSAGESLNKYDGSLKIIVTERSGPNVGVRVTATLHGKNENGVTTKRSRLVFVDLESFSNHSKPESTDKNGEKQNEKQG